MFSRWNRRRSLRTRPIRKPLRARVGLEALETRTLLSLSGLDHLWAEPARAFAAAGPVGYTPAQVRQAYGFDRIRFGDGSIRGDGSGQTIAIVTAYDHPFLENDLRAFNKAFGLPDVPQLTRVNQFGGTKLPQYDPDWALETALDVQWAHAIAPGANILLVHANSARLSDLLTAVDYARNQPGVVTVSMSWGTQEFARQGFFNRYFTTPAGHVDGAGLPGGITFVAASGDTGKPSWPATSANVLAVGGSRLLLNGAGGYVGEVGWQGSGGGVSRFEARPDYQVSVAGETGRSVPDVSYGADPATGFAVYATLPGMGQGWFQVGGTSAGAPQWAGLVAIAAQGRNLRGLPALNGAASSLYALADDAFYDIVTGANGNSAGEGYDLVTGRGSPRADRVVAGLLAAANDGAAAGPAAGEAALVQADEEPPPVDVGNLTLILQTLSELPSNTVTAAVTPLASERLRDLPPPTPQPFVPAPQPSFSVIHYKVGGGDIVQEEPEAGERPMDKPMPAAASAESVPAATAQVASLGQLADAIAPAPERELSPAAENHPAAEPVAGEGGSYRWLAAAGVGLLLGGLWSSRSLPQRWRGRMRRS